jgi:hypothetical protein
MTELICFYPDYEGEWSKYNREFIVNNPELALENIRNGTTHIFEVTDE